MRLSGRRLLAPFAFSEAVAAVGDDSARRLFPREPT
jgi:hypothetical protein